MCKPECVNEGLCRLLGMPVRGRKAQIWFEVFDTHPLSRETCAAYRTRWCQRADVSLEDAIRLFPPNTSAEPPLPNKLQMAKNLAVAVKEHVTAGMPKARPEVQAERKAICEGCELFRHSDKRCSHPKCGCFMEQKWTWAEQKCPLGKW